MCKVNPRSFASIRKAVQEGAVKSRGQFFREIYNAFHTPRVVREADMIIDLTKVDTAPRKFKKGGVIR